MAPTAAERRRAKVCARESQRELGRSAFTTGGRRDAIGADHAATARCNGGSALTHGRHAQATQHPLGHFREHLASNGLTMVERRFGPATGLFGSWDQNKVCSTRPALRFLFKVPDYLSSVTAGN